MTLEELSVVKQLLLYVRHGSRCDRHGSRCDLYRKREAGDRRDWEDAQRLEHAKCTCGLAGVRNEAKKLLRGCTSS